MLARKGREQCAALFILIAQRLRAHELRARQPRAEGRAQLAERRVGHARHRRERELRVDLHCTDAHGRSLLLHVS